MKVLPYYKCLSNVKYSKFSPPILAKYQLDMRKKQSENKKINFKNFGKKLVSKKEFPLFYKNKNIYFKNVFFSNTMVF